MAMRKIYYRSLSASAFPFLFRVGFFAEFYFSYLEILGALDFHR